jgi:hypothetical protein
LDRRLGGPQSLSGRGSEEKNSQPPPGLELPIIKPVAQRYTASQVKLGRNTLQVELGQYMETFYYKNGNVPYLRLKYMVKIIKRHLSKLLLWIQLRNLILQ